MSQAKESYQEALSLNPDNSEINVALGNIYETLEEYDEAHAQYKIGISQGNPASLNGAGRVILQTATEQGTLRSELFQAEAIFRLALSEKYLEDSLKAELHSNLAWTLIKQVEGNTRPETEVKTLQGEAQQHLKTAIALEEKIKQKDPGLGMSYCYLAVLWQQMGQSPTAVQQQWQLCQDRALPATLGQYKTILNYGGSEIATKVDTTGIVSEDTKFLDAK